MRKLSVLLTAVAFSALVVPSAQATVITFDSVPSVGNPIRTTPLTTDGFTFDSAHYHIIDSPGTCGGGCVSDGTNYLGLDGPTLGFPVMMTDALGGAFDLLGLDAAKMWLTVGGLGGFPNATNLHIDGNIMGGGTIAADLLLPGEGSFGLFTLGAGWTNLQSVVFSGDGVATNNSWAIDNIEATASVPEPASLLLLGTGLVAAARRRMKRA